MADSEAFVELAARHPALAQRLPLVRLGRWPTPVQRLSRFAAEQGLPDLYVKREDLCDTECGGNKVRSLEVLLAQAARRGSRRVVTVGAAGSFHVRATAVCARRLGMETTAVVTHQPLASYVRRNLSASVRAGAQIVPCRLATVAAVVLRELVRRDARGGQRAFFVPPGGTNALSSVAQVAAAFELRAQITAGALPEPRWLFVPLGSLGTATGLALGCRLVGLRTTVVGVVIFSRWYCTRGRWLRGMRRTLRQMRLLDGSVPDLRMTARDVVVLGGALGGGYAHFTAEGADAARRLCECEGLEADGTYTAKMYAAAVAFLRPAERRDGTALIWHTYQPGTAMELGPDDVARLPRRLRRYFEAPAQPLDAAMPSGLAASRGLAPDSAEAAGQMG